MEDIKSRSEYQALMLKVEKLVQKADSLGGFENLPKVDLQNFKQYGILAQKYEREVMKLVPLEGKNPLITRIEEEMFERRMKQKEFADLLEISNSRLSDVMNGKAAVSMNLAKKLHSTLGIDGNLILENV